MRRKTPLTNSPPYAVEQVLKNLGANLRTARLRRNLTLEQAASKIGAGRRAVIDAERGKPTTSAVVYMALLWAYDLLASVETIADPARDLEGLARSRTRARARTSRTVSRDDDF
ncbi:MAG: helix-turn-helix transcriptional regulator [Gammaproteobacteria bacterium]|nr:helix-turn-helix transcriptional regulator [Gammaproteobacteria bacterium]